MDRFDPSGAAQFDGIFGLPHGPEDARVWLMPVPFAPTVSYGGGTERGPAAILAASHQVDLEDLQTGRPYAAGIWMAEESAEIRAAHARARAIAHPIIAAGGASEQDAEAVAVVDAAGAEVNARVASFVADAMADGRIPGIVGGDHSVPFGAITTAAEREPGLGVLHVDAHMDMRRAFEGFAWSHASVMANVMSAAPDLGRVVQVGIRDFCAEELHCVERKEGRLVAHFDLEWRRRQAAGEALLSILDDVVRALPERVWVTFDIDGLDPALCPHTGTPVPGGLSFPEACLLLERVVESGRRIVGFDVVEVAPGPDSDWDANVGARVLYKLCGFSLKSS